MAKIEKLTSKVDYNKENIRKRKNLSIKKREKFKQGDYYEPLVERIKEQYAPYGPIIDETTNPPKEE